MSSYEELLKALKENSAKPSGNQNKNNSFNLTTTKDDLYAALQYNTLQKQLKEAEKAAANSLTNKTYDELVREKTILSGRQRRGTAEESAETQKRIDEIDRAILTNNYVNPSDYDKVIADVDRQLAELAREISNNPKWSGDRWVGVETEIGKQIKERDQKKQYLETTKNELQQKRKLAEYTELPRKLGEHNFQIGVNNGKNKTAYNPTLEQMKQYIAEYNKGNTMAEKPQIVDPLGFYEANPDLWQAEGVNSPVATTFYDEIYNQAQQYHWDEITPEERDVYYFTLNRLGTEKAMEYLSLLEMNFGQRYAANLTARVEKLMDESGWFGGTLINLAMVPVNLLGGIEATLDNIRNAASGKKINPYSSANRLRLYTTSMRSGTAKEWAKAGDVEVMGRNIFEQAFNIMMSSADSIFGGYVLGPTAYMIAAGSNAAASTAQDIYDRGGSTAEIFWGSTLAGVAEGLFEKVSIGSLLDNTKNVLTFKQLFMNTLKQGGVELSEEVATEITNQIVDDLNMGERSVYNLRVKELVDGGMTLEEANKKALTERMSDVGWAAISGFMSGGGSTIIMGAPSVISNRKTTSEFIRTGRKVKDEGSVKSYLEYAKDNHIAADIIESYDGRNADRITDVEAGQLYAAVIKDVYNKADKINSQAQLKTFTQKYADAPESIQAVALQTAMTVAAEHPEWLGGSESVEQMVADSEGETATEVEGGLPSVSAVAPEADAIKDLAYEERGLERLTDEQKFLKTIGEALGRKVSFKNLDEWVDDPETGERTLQTPGGMYNRTTGEITLNNSPNAKESALRFVLKHELSHFAEYDLNTYTMFMNSVMDSEVFKNWVKSNNFENAGDMNRAYIKKYAKSNLPGTEVFKDPERREFAAYTEMVADFVGDTLFNDDISRFRDALSNVDASTLNKFKRWMLDIFAKLKKLFGKKDATRKQFEAIAKLEKQFVETCKSAQRVWEQNHKPTAEQQKTSTEGEISPDSEGVVVNDDGEPVAHSIGDGTVQFSLSTFESDGRTELRKYLEKCVSNKRLTQAEMDEMLDGIEEIYEICKEFKDKYAPFGTWSDAEVVRDTHGKPVFSVVTPNGEYKMNLDFSLVCRKRRTLDAVFNALADQGVLDDFELGQKSVVKINEIIRKYGFETACTLCFVDAKRFRQAAVADSFVKLYNELVESLVPESEKSNINHFDFVGYGYKSVENGIDSWDNSTLDFSHIDKVLKEYGSKTVEHKAAQYIKTHPEARKLLIRGEFMSSKGFDAVKTKNPQIMKLYNSKKGTGGPKAAFGDVQYLNEIIQKARFWTPKKAFAVGGVRIQSFSDYVPRMVFDYVQMVYDLSATKLPAHAYTKEALFVKQFGLTGVKINMSLIPAIAKDGVAPGLDKNGNYVWAGESFDFNTAIEIQNAEGYTENCGTIAVGVSREHILKLLRDPNIRMVIPYHKSGLNPIVAHMNHIDAFKDYTGSQNTLDKNGDKVSKDFNFNQALHDMGENGSPKAVAKQYLEWCEKNGYTPKFAEFSKNPNYYKLLEDFNLYDKSGHYVAQHEVKAVFPTDESAFGSMKELIRQGLEEDAIIEGNREKLLPEIVDEIKTTLPKTEAEIPEDVVEQAETDLEKDMQYSLPREVEAEYDKAVANGDVETQKRLVGEAAKSRGFIERAMHGTSSFGFTSADVTKSDDGMSFFATDSLETASTYASTDRVRKISDTSHGLSDAELNATMKKVKHDFDDWVKKCEVEYGIDISDVANEFNTVIDEQMHALKNGKSAADSVFEVDYLIRVLKETLTTKMYDAYSSDPSNKKMSFKKFSKSDFWHDFLYEDFYQFRDTLYESIDKLFGSDSGIYDFYINPEGLLVVNGNGSNWNDIKSSDLPDIKAKENKVYRKIHKSWTTRNVALWAKDNGYKGVKFIGITDSGNGQTVQPATIYTFFNPQEQVKSADPITYDDNGDMIPLSERFNPQNDDIRWSLPDNKEELIRKLKDGQITEEQFAEAWDKKPSKENPASIANLKPEDASTTPPLQKKEGKNKGDKESEFYGSAMASSIFDNSFKNDIKDDSYIKTYQSITNKETLKKAADYLDENGQTAVNEWWAKSPDSVSLVDIATGLILMDRYQRVGDYESASAVAQKVRQMGTSAGQKVQIFSILGRFTPEGMAFYAQKTLDEAYKRLVDTKAKKWAEKNSEKFKLTQEEIDTIYRKTVLASSMPENSREKAILLAEISALIQNKIPPRISDSIKAWQRISMLLNFKTNIRNIVGNAGMVPVFIASDYFGTMIDKVIAKKTGVRTTGGFNLKGSGTAFAKGFYESWDDLKRDVHTRQEELNRFENEGFRGQEAPGKNFNANTNSKVWNKIAEKLNGIDRFTSFCLEAGDRTFFEMWLTNSLNNQMKLNGVTEPTPEMIDVATNEALQRTWQDVNKMSRFVSKFKQWANGANIGGYGLGDVVVKFTKTPANIAKAIVDFSPAGFILATKKMVDMKKAFEKGQLTPTMQNQAVKSMSNAITGTLIYLVVGALASAGVLKLSGDGDEDKDVSNFEKYIVGIPPYSMEIFGVNVTYDWMQPFGSTLAIVSEFMENRQDKSTGWVTDFTNAFLAGGEIFTQQSFIKGLYDFFSNADENILYGVTSSLLSEPSVFIPQLLSQTASIIDPKRRSTYDSNQLIYSLNQLINKIPGLRTTLPEQVNVLGEDVENNQYGNLWTAFFAPYNTYPDSYGKVAEEVYALYKETGDKEVIPRVAPKSFSIKGHAYTFTTEEKNQFQRDMGEASAEMLDKLFKSNDYKKLTDSQKATAIKSIYSYSMKLAKFEVVKKDYDYDLISDIVGYKDKDKTIPILTRAKYSSLSKQGKIQLIEEEMFTKTELKFKNYDDAVKYYIEKAQ